MKLDAAAIAITAWGIHVPGTRMADLLDGREPAPACSDEHADQMLGRRGLLGKDPATRLALCAVHRALDLPPGAPRRGGLPDPRVAVVASSNFGNVATVRNIVSAIRRNGWREVSALDAPNASSNVLASTVAIWFRFGGPNLMVCSGATSGLDAVALGCVLLRSRRADRVVVVGAEPNDAVATAMHAQRRGCGPTGRGSLVAAAAALVLALAADSKDDVVYVGPIRPGTSVRLAGNSSSGENIDCGGAIGDSYGALGVLQVAVAASRIAASPRGSKPILAVVCGDTADGWRSTTLSDSPILQRLGVMQEESLCGLDG